MDGNSRALSSNSLVGTERFHVAPGTSNLDGRIVVDWGKTLFLSVHGILGLAGLLFFATGDALAVFLGLTVVTICGGHSVGMHRLLIHRSFAAPRWLEYGLVWLGTLVGMAGLVGMIRTHDLRDWHQRQTTCPPHPAHQAGFWQDAWWQLCCRYDLARPPQFMLEARVADDPLYAWMERWWWAQNAPLAALLFALGGAPWLLWGWALRVFVSLVGHWLVGHFAHRQGHQGWRIAGLPVQGYNVRGWGLVTFGENWHGNHHAFPYSARLGVEPGQIDPGFWLISALAAVGLAWDVKTPGDLPDRDGLTRVQRPLAATGRATHDPPHDTWI